MEQEGIEAQEVLKEEERGNILIMTTLPFSGQRSEFLAEKLRRWPLGRHTTTPVGCPSSGMEVIP